MRLKIGIRDRIKIWFLKQNIKNKEKMIKENFEVVINDIDTFSLYLKDREKKYILIKDKNFPFMLNNPDIEWIEMNKNNFDYYGEFYNFETMFEKIQNLEDKERMEQKQDNDYLKKYLEYSVKDYSALIEKMKRFEIDGEQYQSCIDRIKEKIEDEVKNILNHYTNINIELNSTRTYDEIINNLIDEEVFVQKYPFYKSIDYEDSISHCGYPDYMWQSGAEGTFIELDKIPNSKNNVFTYNEYIGGTNNDGYITKVAIVSEEERKVILKHWDDFQYRNELQFERDYINSVMSQNQEKAIKTSVFEKDEEIEI